jgi:hypothetical protein
MASKTETDRYIIERSQDTSFTERMTGHDLTGGTRQQVRITDKKTGNVGVGRGRTDSEAEQRAKDDLLSKNLFR